MTAAVCASACDACPRASGPSSSRSPSWLHRLGDLRGQPGAPRQQHASAPARAGRRRERRRRVAARPRHLRALWARAARLLQWPPLRARLPLCRRRHRQRARRVLPARRRTPDRCGRRRGVPRDRRPGGARGSRSRHRPARCRSRCGVMAQCRHDVDARTLRARNAPSAAIAPSIPTTAWSHAASKPSGSDACSCSRPLKRPRSSRARAPSDPAAGRAPAILALGSDLERVWSAPTTTDRDRKELLRTLLGGSHHRDRHRRPAGASHPAVAWRAPQRTRRRARGVHTPAIRTDEDTIDLLRRLAVHYPDAVIAGILNRQGRRTATGLRFTVNRVSSLRTHWHIPRFATARPTSGG